MSHCNNLIRPLYWDELTTAAWDVIYTDCGISLLKCSSDFPTISDTYEIRMVAILICYSGNLILSSNHGIVEIGKGDVLVCMPGTILKHERASADLTYKVVCVAPDVVAKHMAKKGYFTKFTRRKAPFAIIHFDRQMLHLVDAYYTILEIKNGQNDNADQRFIVSDIIGCMLFDILRVIPDQSSAEAIRQTQGYKYVIFQRFIQMATNDRGALHSVKEYAQRLNISSKYLSVICRESSGKSAGQWINVILENEIKRLLQYTDQSLKEIAVRTGFSNGSVFSKYLRQHFKMTGAELRRHLRDLT